MAVPRSAGRPSVVGRSVAARSVAVVGRRRSAVVVGRSVVARSSVVGRSVVAGPSVGLDCGCGHRSVVGVGRLCLWAT